MLPGLGDVLVEVGVVDAVKRRVEAGVAGQEDLDDEAAAEDLLHRGTKGVDVGSLAAWRIATLDCPPF